MQLPFFWLQMGSALSSALFPAQAKERKKECKIEVWLPHAPVFLPMK